VAIHGAVVGPSRLVTELFGDEVRADAFPRPSNHQVKHEPGVVGKSGIKVFGERKIALAPFSPSVPRVTRVPLPEGVIVVKCIHIYLAIFRTYVPTLAMVRDALDVPVRRLFPVICRLPREVFQELLERIGRDVGAGLLGTELLYVFVEKLVAVGGLSFHMKQTVGVVCVGE
jgi:hypothetical protein